MEALDPATLSEVNAKGFVPDEVRNTFFRKLRSRAENRCCFECTARNPTWISLTYGVYLCLECSGEHRRKGVHISFVRSVELDSFTPEQMVQMALGGNGKATEFFKQSGMGKSCEGGRQVDYNSKPAQRYKAQMEKEAAAACEKLGVDSKAAANALKDVAAKDTSVAAKAKAPAAAPAAAGYPAAAKAAAPAPKAQPKIAPISVPATMKVMVVPTGTTSPTNASTSAVPKPSGFAAKQKAKEIDFDFDFDELEFEANNAPVPAPKAPMPKTIGQAPPTAPARFAPAAAASTGPSETTAKYAGKKAISSDDFFHQDQSESAQGRMERESRYNKFAASGAISSDAFFGEGDMDRVRKTSSQNSIDELKAGLSRGAEMLTTYMDKVRN